MPSASKAQLPAVMVDPLGHEHAVGRAGEEDRNKGERVSARIDQPPRSQRQREQQQKIRQQRRDRDRPPLRAGSAKQRPKQQDQSRDRQIDQPRPVDVRAVWRVHPVLAKVEPALPVQQRADLHHPHIVVGIAQGEVADAVPAVEDEPAQERPSHDQQRDRLPVAREPIQRPCDYDLVLALPHLSRCSRQTLNGKQTPQRFNPTVMLMLSNLTPERRTVLAQLVRFVISGATVTALGVSRLCAGRARFPLAPAGRQRARLSSSRWAPAM